MPGKRTKRVLLLIGTLALTAVTAAITYVRYAPRRTPLGQPSLVNLPEDDLRLFEQAFNEGTSKQRVVVMLSPT